MLSTPFFGELVSHHPVVEYLKPWCHQIDKKDNASELLIDWKSRAKLFNFCPNFIYDFIIFNIITDVTNPVSDILTLRFTKTTRRCRGSSNSNSTGYKWRLRVIWYRILINSNMG